MNGLSNLPPGCSSPDGGLDPALEEAEEHLAESLPGVDDATLAKLSEELGESSYIKAFAFMVEGQTLTNPVAMAELFTEAMTAEYNAGHDAGLTDGAS